MGDAKGAAVAAPERPKFRGHPGPELRIGDRVFRSRLAVGTGKYRDFEETARALEASGAELITVAIRRVNLDRSKGPSLLDHIDRSRYQLLPNTAGCYSVDDAVLTAQLAREALGTNLVKLEVLGDPATLFPDNRGLLRATEILLKDGFEVLPYTSDDPITCRELEAMGCPAVMPLGAPIGSGLGIRNPYNLRIILETIRVPVIVDAGVGTASDVAVAMELGADGVLLNTAIAAAGNPVQMAEAMRHAVLAGRLAYESGRMPMRLYANASSPLEGVVSAQPH